ncbi:Retrotransposon protein [Gossypium australe]|uniref:Retrotransposon protein n=1 Tax=Gossypium australe TaxID=47621 RepID=A0A5B6VD27_9ROSI|nr:Retrotransposon protein [Gossypium australe]
MSSNQARPKAEEAESNAPASVQRDASSSKKPKSEGREFIRTNLAVQQPPSPVPQLVLEMSQCAEPFRTSKPPAIADDDPERAEFWLEYTIRVLDELSCTLAECLKCAVSLLKDTTYHWWNTITSFISRENITWEFFQTEFRKKYISQRFLDQKKKDFLELKQGSMTVP